MPFKNNVPFYLISWRIGINSGYSWFDVIALKIVICSLLQSKGPATAVEGQALRTHPSISEEDSAGKRFNFISNREVP